MRFYSISRQFATIVLGGFLILIPLAGFAQPSIVPKDSIPNTPLGIAISAGYGGVATWLGAEYSLDLTHGHFILSFRGGGSLPDNGSYQSSGDPSYSVEFSPKEYVQDFGILAGYRTHGNSGWLSLLGGPTYIGGLLRGKNLISADTSLPSFFGGTTITRHYDSAPLNSLGLTVQVVGGFILASWLGIGLGISVTSNFSYTYAAVLMSLYLGRLR